MKRILVLAGIALSALPLLPSQAEARPPWERHEDRWERHERREAWREERWRRERWREARRRDEWRRERYYRQRAYGPPVAYAPPAPGVTLQLNLR
ncbi:hypothetical protein [Roseomonas sp. WA12]